MPHPLDLRAYIPQMLRAYARDFERGVIDLPALTRRLRALRAHYERTTSCPAPNAQSNTSQVPPHSPTS